MTRWHLLHVHGRSGGAELPGELGDERVVRVVHATTPSDALAMVADEAVACAVVDLDDAAASVDLLVELRDRRPEVARMVIAQPGDARTVIDAINRAQVVAYLTRPVADEAFRRALRGAVDCFAADQAHRDQRLELARTIESLEATHREQVRLYEMAITDDKTGVHNQPHFRLRLGEEFERVRRYGGELALVLLAVDGFPAMTEARGALVADAALRDLAQILVESQRATDIVARSGPASFALILPETGRSGARAFADRLRERIASHEFLDANAVAYPVTVSLGVAAFPHPDVASKDALLTRAEDAVRRAQATGNRVED